MLTRASAVRAIAACIASIAFTSCSAPVAAEHTAMPLPPGEVHFDADSPKLATLHIDTVRARAERVLATLPAHVSADENHTARVLSPVTGRVIALLAQPGDRVQAGQALARLISTDASQASSEVARARAIVSVTDAALTRASDLYAHHVIAMRELEQARADAAQAHVEESRARNHVTQLGLAPDATGMDYVLRAPIAGVVVERTVNPGAEVRPDASIPLFTISSMSQVWLTARVYQNELPYVQNGVRLVFTTDAMPGRSFEARVSFVSATLDATTRTGLVRAVIANADGALRPEMFGEARLLTQDKIVTPVVATRALVTHGRETIVYVERTPGTFVRRVVRVGDDDGTWASIAEGLRVGERVVTDGSLLLDAEANHVPG